jgi:hydroxymethylglutaryl-CoA reductase (NADPH)
MQMVIINRLGKSLPALRSFLARVPQARMFSAKSDDTPASQLSDAQLLVSLRDGKMQHYNLETDIGNATRAANIRRLYLAETIGDKSKAAGINSLPFDGYDYQALVGANCENVIGYMPIPVGVFGPLKVDDKMYHIPMATHEGCLVASANRGARAITQCGGAVTALLKDGITRSPVLRSPSLREAENIVQWLGMPENFERIRLAFNSSSRFASLLAIKTAVAGRSLFLRFACTTGDAMGMNMVSKGTQKALAELASVFPDTKLVRIERVLCLVMPLF